MENEFEIQNNTNGLEYKKDYKPRNKLDNYTPEYWFEILKYTNESKEEKDNISSKKSNNNMRENENEQKKNKSEPKNNAYSISRNNVDKIEHELEIINSRNESKDKRTPTLRKNIDSDMKNRIKLEKDE